MESDGVWRPSASFDKNQIQWPLSYSLTPNPAGAPRREFWDYSYYRGPENQSVQIQYSSSWSESEAIAQGFLDEPVLGFDMEWPLDENMRTQLREKVAMIQLACESKIALFHIALHEGQTSEELIAPSLRRIIESPHILKTGVAIMCADFKRLRDRFQLEPRGAFELSHLFRLITFGPRKPEEVTVRMCKLSTQVKRHFGLPLNKGDIRRSDWSLPLDKEQKTYAATDAYAGFMLFHCMNAKRLGISPVPPLPKLAESYLPFGYEESPDLLVQLEPSADRPEVAVMTATHFFPRPPSRMEIMSQLRARMQASHQKRARDDCIKEEIKERERFLASVSSEPEISKMLLAQLVSHRKELARTRGIPPYIIASNKVLEELARHRPANKSELLKVHGVGEQKTMTYGSDWLRMIAQDLAEHFEAKQRPEPSESSVSDVPIESLPPPEDTELLHPQSCDYPSKRMKIKNVGRSKEVILSPPTLSTGLSFQFAETQLDGDEIPAEKDGGDVYDEPDDSSVFATDIPLATSSELRHKEPRTLESPCQEISAPSLAPNSSPTSISAPTTGSEAVEETKQLEHLSLEQRLLRKKLDACVKSVTSLMNPKPTQPIVSNDALDRLVTTLPQTLDEFHQVAGLQGFIHACQGAKKNLWEAFSTWTRTAGLVKSS
ncbi:hypothetical protein M434DRAFT_73527 [Hypoxylon sp. CO27-5]|nr:hypothetical protein M434DRAFT_73527 [Hypoxylon sp. CO27-5]